MAAPEPETTHRGVLLCLLAMVVFACQDAITKHLAQSYAVPQFIMVRYLAFSAFAVLYLRSRGELGGAFKAWRVWLQITRSLLIVAEIAVFALALRHLGLAETHALFATFPLMVTALSVPLLRERVGPRRWAAVCVGFLGTLVILRPGLGVFQPAAAIALVAALGFALYNITTSLASRRDRFATSMLYMAVVGAVAATVAGVPVWRTPDALGWALMGLLSVTGICGHLLLIRALEYAPASVLQPFNYTLLVWATIVGLIVFGEFPDQWTMVGAGMIVASGLYVIFRERQRRPELRSRTAPSSRSTSESRP